MSIAAIPLTYTKEDLLAELAKRRKKAERADAKALAAHQKRERAYLAEFRRRCREAARWDYEQVKRSQGRIWGDASWNAGRAPSCPISQVSRIDSLVAMIQKQNQQRFTLSRRGKWSDIYALMTEDVPEIKGLC